ncbi:MAG TPA: hypothetical protein VF306_20585 [Pirellulales bacterium]
MATTAMAAPPAIPIHSSDELDSAFAGRSVAGGLTVRPADAARGGPSAGCGDRPGSGAESGSFAGGAGART